MLTQQSTITFDVINKRITGDTVDSHTHPPLQAIHSHDFLSTAAVAPWVFQPNAWALCHHTRSGVRISESRRTAAHDDGVEAS
jgi:hypothetical protein